MGKLLEGLDRLTLQFSPTEKDEIQSISVNNETHSSVLFN